MTDRLESRLKALKHDFDAGRTVLREIEEQDRTLREKLLRISGAIQVLEEVLTEVRDEKAATEAHPVAA